MPATEPRICEHCKKTVIGICLCNHVPGEPINYSFPSRHELNLALYHALWDELHSKQDPTPEWLGKWMNRIPNFKCGCRKWLREYVKNNPPVYGDGWYEYTVVLHDAVNCKLGKPMWRDILRSN